MHFFATAVAALSLFSLAAAETFTVIVGKDGGLTYDPPSVIAQAGDTVAFRFVSKNHTVTQSSFATPCQQLTTPALGVDSGYQPVAADATTFPEWSITVDNASAPLWFYCAQGAHCKNGMVFAINPTAERTYEAFLANAAASVAPGTANTTGTTGAAGASSSATGGAASPTGSATGATTSTAADANGSAGRSASSTLLLAALGIIGALVL